jgi:hypothetical protein
MHKTQYLLWCELVSYLCAHAMLLAWHKDNLSLLEWYDWYGLVLSLQRVKTKWWTFVCCGWTTRASGRVWLSAVRTECPRERYRKHQVSGRWFAVWTDNRPGILPQALDRLSTDEELPSGRFAEHVDRPVDIRPTTGRHTPGDRSTRDRRPVEQQTETLLPLIPETLVMFWKVFADVGYLSDPLKCRFQMAYVFTMGNNAIISNNKSFSRFKWIKSVLRTM